VADVIVRPPEASDEQDWRALWQGFQTHFGGAIPAQASAQTWRLLLDESAPLNGLLAIAGGRACGLAHYSFTPFAWTATPVCFLQDLYVDESARGLGAGRALVQGVYDVAQAAGAANVFWLADAADERLLRFYRAIALETPYVRFMQKPWEW
jgi:GNAT superfamily N-acetyltransferase